MANPSVKSRRINLVERGGVEMFEVRVVLWFNKKGEQKISVEVTPPEEDNPDPRQYEVLGALERAKPVIARMYREGELG